MTFVDSIATRPTLQMQRFFDAPRPLVWRAWTNPEVMVLDQRAIAVGNGRPSASAMPCWDSRKTASRW